MVKLGQTVTRTPSFCLDLNGRKIKESVKGTVVWIHPKHRFHVVEFQTGGKPIQEAFAGVEK